MPHTTLPPIDVSLGVLVQLENMPEEKGAAPTGKLEENAYRPRVESSMESSKDCMVSMTPRFIVDLSYW